MKNNQPVTQREVPMNDGTILVSKTDLKGTITFCNDEFIRISGFSETELLGRSHNIVRHPDMPPAAFADLWTTIQSGQPWHGLVKNRTKHGDHYWVYANVTPIFEKGRITGYMSVRTKPSAQQIEEAEQRYQQMWQEQADRPARHRPFDKPLTWWRRHRFAALIASATLLQLLAIGTIAAGAPTSLAATMLLLPLLPLALLAVTIRQRLATPLQTLSKKLDSILEGNFFDWIDPIGEDELGQVMRRLRMVQIKLGFDVVDANDTVLKLLSLVSRLDDLAQRFGDAACSMEESAANLTEINSLVKNNAENTVDANRMTEHVLAQVKKSRSALNDAVEAMSVIDESTIRIADIITVIDEIAFKTNLLALNAAVEAAHAGDQGKGFAVVADEVRNLSQHTSAAASEVKALIQDNIDKVRNGAGMIDLSSEALHQVVREMEKVGRVISEISVSGKEQAVGIEMLSNNIQTINETLQHSSDMIQETSSRSEQIGQRAEEYVEKSRIRTAA